MGVGRRVVITINAAVGVEAGDVAAGGTADVGEGAAEEDFTIGLDGDSCDDVVGDGREGRVDGAIEIETGYVVAREAADDGEITADEGFAIGLDGVGEDAAVGGRVEGGVDRAVGVEAGEAVAGDRDGGAAGAELGEVAADDDFGVGLSSESVDGAVAISGEGGVKGAVDQDAGEEGAGRRGSVVVGAEDGEGAADDEGAVGLDEQAVHVTVGVGIERAVEGAVGVETSESATGGNGAISDRLNGAKSAADHDLAVDLDHDAVDGGVGLGVELGIGVTVDIEAHEAGANGGDAAFGVERGKGATGDDFTVALKGEAEDGGVGAGVVSGVEGAVGVEAGDVIANRGADRAEGAADDDLAVSLDDDGGDLRSEAAGDVGVKRGVERAVGIEPSEAVARGGSGRVVGLKRGEETADKDLAVGLERDGGDLVVGVGVEVEIEGTVGVETGDVVAVDFIGGAVGLDGGERAADDDFTIALSGGDEDGAVDVGVVAVVGRGALAEEGRGGAGKQKHTRADERAGAGAEKR